MKAEELMITTSDVMVGDWVRITIEGEQYPAVVNSIKLNTEEIGVSFLAAPGDWEDGDGYDEIEPIPLTDEILKQNGFKYFHKNYASLGYEHPFQLKMNEWPDENGLGGLWTICDMVEIRYVHELQHALRLCGIEKEIIIKED